MKITQRRSAVPEESSSIARNVVKRVYICPSRLTEVVVPSSEYLLIGNISIWSCFSVLSKLVSHQDWQTVQASSSGKDEVFNPTKTQWTLLTQSNTILFKLSPEDYQKFGLGQQSLVVADARVKSLSKMRYVRVPITNFAELYNPLTDTNSRNERLALIFRNILTTAYITATPSTLALIQGLLSQSGAEFGEMNRIPIKVTERNVPAAGKEDLNLDLMSIEELDLYLGCVAQNCSSHWMQANDVRWGIPACRVIVEEGACVGLIGAVIGQEMLEGEWFATLEYTAVNAPCWQADGEPSSGGGYSVVQLSQQLSEGIAVRVNYVIENYLGR